MCGIRTPAETGSENASEARARGHLSLMRCCALWGWLLLSGCTSSVNSKPPEGDGDHEVATGGDSSGGGGAGTGGEVSSTGGNDGGESLWPGQRRAAVSLTYDDGLDGQLKYAVPALDAHGFKATFFLSSFQGVDHIWSLPNLTDPLSPRHQAWAAVKASGHELGAHTVFHPCANNNAGYRPEDYDLSRMAAELDESSARLSRLGAVAPLTFAYPCESDVVGISGGTSYAPLVEERYLAARVSTVGVTVDGALDLHGVAQKFGDTEGANAAELIAYVDEALFRGGWAVFTFHGIGPPEECNINQFDLDACALNYLAIDSSVHEALLDYLLENQGQVWTAPFGEVAAHLASAPEN
jgi:peptidoglycan-N-acetylglucosamine deacetylase